MSQVPVDRRRREVRPWNVRPGDLVKRYARAVHAGERPKESDAVYETVRYVEKDRNTFSGETYWKLFYGPQGDWDARWRFIPYYRLDYGMPVRVEIWR